MEVAGLEGHCTLSGAHGRGEPGQARPPAGTCRPCSPQKHQREAREGRLGEREKGDGTGEGREGGGQRREWQAVKVRGYDRRWRRYRAREKLASWMASGCLKKACRDVVCAGTKMSGYWVGAHAAPPNGGVLGQHGGCNRPSLVSERTGWESRVLGGAGSSQVTASGFGTGQGF